MAPVIPSPRTIIVLAMAAFCWWAPAAAFGQVLLPPHFGPHSEMQPASPWTFRVSAGAAVSPADGSRAGQQLHLAVERTITDIWSVRVQGRGLHIPYDLGVNPVPVTATNQLDLGIAIVKIIAPSALTHAYAGVGTSFLLMRFSGVTTPHNKAVGVVGFVGVEFHPQSRRWGGLLEFFFQARSMPPQLANGDVFMNQLGISIGASLPVHRRQSR